MEKININCPHCHKKYKVDPRLKGRFVDCKQCNQNFQVTDSGAMPLGVPDPLAPVAGAPTPQAFDPLTPDRPDDSLEHAQLPPEETTPPAEPATTPVRNWQSELKKHKKQSPFGANERAMLFLGGFFIVFGIIINLLPLFGKQVPRLQEMGTMANWIGLVLGLVGAGLLAASLRNFKTASLISGMTSGLFLLIVFGLALLGGSDKGEVAEKGEDGNVKVVDSFLAIPSDWFDKFPSWQGFEGMSVRPADTDRWNRFEIAGTTISSSFPGKPESGQEQLRINRESSKVKKLTASEKGLKYFLGVFEHPKGNKKSDKERLIDVETAISKTGVLKDSEPTTVDGNPARVYTLDHEDGKMTHGQVIALKDKMVHTKVHGASVHIPGPSSLGFFQALQLSSDSSANQGVPDFTLTDSDKARQATMTQNVREIEGWMDEYIHKRCRMNFSPQYLSISAGVDSGSRKFLVHPRKLPMLGIDAIVTKTSRGKLVVSIAPIYEEATDEDSIMAPEGYGIAGMNVNASRYVKGIQLIYMKVTPVGFDTSQLRLSPWIGASTSGRAQKIGADGRPVYGFWTCGKKSLKSIGFIRESN